MTQFSVQVDLGSNNPTLSSLRKNEAAIDKNGNVFVRTIGGGVIIHNEGVEYVEENPHGNYMYTPYIRKIDRLIIQTQ